MDEFHLTLKFLGDIDKKKADEIKEILKTIKQSKFRLKFSELGAFPSNQRINVIWVGVLPAETVIEL